MSRVPEWVRLDPKKRELTVHSDQKIDREILTLEGMSPEIDANNSDVPTDIPKETNAFEFYETPIDPILIVFSPICYASTTLSPISGLNFPI